MIDLSKVKITDEMIRKLIKSSELTDFQKSVLSETIKIPYGTTISYKDMAIRVNHPNAFRAVGTALKNNPYPIIIPCHAVISGDGELNKYSNGGTEVKRYLISLEKLKLKPKN